MNTVSAPALAGRYPLVIIPPGEKGPKTKGWPDLRPSVEQVESALSRGFNLGIILGERSGLIDLEIDGEQGEESYRKLLGEEPRTPCWKSARGRHRLHGYDERFGALGAKFTHPDYPGLEFRIGAQDAQSVIPPSVVDGFTREWDVDLADCEPAKLPESVIEKILALKAPVEQASYGHDEFNLGLQPLTEAKLVGWLRKNDIPFRVENGTADKAGKRLVKFPYCPIRGPKHDDGDATIFLNEDGSFAFSCFHAKCADKTFPDLEALYGPYSPPIIKVGPDIHRVAAEAIYALRGADIYQRGGVLVEKTNEAPRPKLCLNDNGAPRFRQVPMPTLGLILSEHARWKQWNERSKEYVPCAPPQRIVSAVDAADDLPGIPVATGIVSAPVLRADGSILAEHGYDRLTGLYLNTDGNYPALMDPREAIDVLTDILADFPFESEAHRSGWIAALVTLLTRHAFPGPAPLFLFDANASRVGKGLLTDLLAIILEARKASRYTAPDRDDEMRKLITAIAISGAPYLMFDNLKGRFGGPAIEAAMTAGRWSDRILGVNKHVDLPLSLVWLATANNASLTVDMIGRTCHSRLNTALERPDQRTDFRHADLPSYAKSHRAKLAIAALSIPAAYIKAGRPDQHLPGWGGFEGWSDLVRSSLVWAGQPDPDTRTALAEQADDDTAILRQLMDGWQELGFPATVATALECLATTTAAENYPTLREVVREIPGDTARALGNMLKHFRGRVVGGRKFERTSHKIPKWQVVEAQQ